MYYTSKPIIDDDKIKKIDTQAAGKLDAIKMAKITPPVINGIFDLQINKPAGKQQTHQKARQEIYQPKVHLEPNVKAKTPIDEKKHKPL